MVCIHKCFTGSQELARDVHKFHQSVIFLRVYNFPNEEDSVGELIQNHQEKWSIESDSRWARKIPRSPGDLLHCGPGRLSAILVNIQHGSVDHLQGTQQTASSWQSSKKRAACPPLHFGQPKGGCLEQGWAAAVLGRSSPIAPIVAPAAITHPPSLLVQRGTLKLQAAKEHSRWLMTRNSGSKETW